MINNNIFIVVLLFTIFAIGGLIYVIAYKGKGFIQPQQDEDEQQDVIEQHNVQRGIGRMNIRNRRLNNNNNDVNNNNNVLVQEQDDDDEDSLSDISDDDGDNVNNTGGVGGGNGSNGITAQHPMRRMSTKKLEKLKMKAEKKKYREYEQQQREERKKKEQEQDELDKQKKQLERQNELLKEEQERKEREELERIQDEDYKARKSTFTLEEEGQAKQPDSQDENLLHQFIEYLKRNKVCLMEDVAAQFEMKTNQVVERIKTLEKEGLISGVIDDRGKFIYITKEEMESISKFIQKRGRVTIEQISKESNKLIDLSTPVSDSNNNNNNNNNTPNHPTSL